MADITKPRIAITYCSQCNWLLRAAWMGQELLQTLHLLMGLRLQAGLQQLRLQRPVSGEVDPARLSTLERDLLKDALAVVKRFKAVLHQRLRLDAA